MATTHAQPRPGATTTAAVPRPASWPIAVGALGLAALVLALAERSPSLLPFETLPSPGAPLHEPIGLGCGALLWAVARRTLVQPGR